MFRREGEGVKRKKTVRLIFTYILCILFTVLCLFPIWVLFVKRNAFDYADSDHGFLFAVQSPDRELPLSDGEKFYALPRVFQ